MKLLAELDLLKDNWCRSDEDEVDFAMSADEISLSDSASLGSLDAVDCVAGWFGAVRCSGGADRNWKLARLNPLPSVFYPG